MPITWMLLLALATAAVLHALLRSGLGMRIAVDTPNHRSLHTKITPRIGGFVAIPFTLGATILLVPSQWLPALLGFVLAAISFLDDRFGLPIAVRFLSHIVAAALMAMSLPQATIWQAIPIVLGIVWMTNLFNFMDGSDGLAGGMAMIGFTCYGIAASSHVGLANTSFLLAAGAFGFLALNFPPARVFLGDAGSVAFGFLAAALGIMGYWHAVWAWWFPLLVFLPFIADATVTLLRRMLRGEKFWRAHREHYYQRLVQMGWSHRRLALSEYCLMLISGTLAITLPGLALSLQKGLLILMLLIYVGLMLVVDNQWRKFHQSQS